MPSIIVALLLVAHGLVHALFFSPQPPDEPDAAKWPFDLTRSWVLAPLGVRPGTMRTVGAASLILLVVAYVAAAVGLLGIVPALFVPAMVVGSVTSLVMLGLFFHRWLLLGVAIDVVLLWAVLLNGWVPDGVAS
jgi:hypothetical protein